MSSQSTLTVIAEELALAFQPFTDAVTSEEHFFSFMLELGWDFSQMPKTISDLAGPAKALIDILESGSLEGDQLSSFANSLRSFIQAIKNLQSSPASAFLGITDPNEFKNTFPEQIVGYLIAEYLLDHHPTYGRVFQTLGIIRVEDVAATATRPAYTHKFVAFSDFGAFFNDPLVFLKNAYSWDTANFKAENALEIAAELGEAFGVHVAVQPMLPSITSVLTAGGLNLQDFHGLELRWPLLEAPPDAPEAELGISLTMLPQTGGAMPGFALLPYAEFSFEEDIELSEDWKLRLELAAEASGGIAISVRPNGIQIQSELTGSPSTASAGARFAVALINDPQGNDKIILIGSSEGSRFEIGSISVKGGGRVDTNGQNDVFGEFTLNDAAIVIDAGEDADSFLGSILPDGGIRLDFSLLLGLSKSQGLYFGGSGGLEVALPAHLSLGPIEVNGAILAVKPSGGNLPVEIGANIKGNLGPLQAVVENIGLKAIFAFPGDQNGNLGPVDLSLGFKPPNGVGLSIDAGVVKGGGYLFFDFDREEYAGALELVFSGFLTLKAIGLITTKMPDGSKGFSMLIIITAEFGSGLQLGFGFTLLGVGGIVGLNRTMRLDALVEGVRTGSINSVMFPTDVVANAPRIISDLRNFFPPENGIFLIGPLAKLGWGTPTLVSLSLGIVFEIPGNIAILGVLRVVLPDEKAPLIVLQVAFIGAIEFDKSRAWFFASIFESRVLFMTLEGEMGLLIGWGNDANFVISVGGFHPRFDPPPLPFPVPRRVAVNILNESWGRIRVECYFAVTSNTVQFGAKAELFFGFSAISISGHIAFDAMIQFSPFWFIVEISGSVSLKVFGIGLFSISLKFSLEGPSNWRAKGTGKLKLLFFSVSANFDESWGEKKDTTLPPIEVMPILEAEYNKTENWTASLPASSSLSVSLRKLDEEEGLVLHPVGSLTITQRAVPLDITIDKFGNQSASDANLFTVKTEPGGFGKKGDKQESFAIGQFQNLKDSEKLSRPAFEPETAGLELAVEGEQLATSKATTRCVRYEQIIIDNNFKRFQRRFVGLFDRLFGLFLKGSAIAKHPGSMQSKKQFEPFEEKITVNQPGYAVAFNMNNAAYAPEAVSFSSEAQAREFLNRTVQGNASLKSSLHIIQNHELNTAA